MFGEKKLAPCDKDSSEYSCSDLVPLEMKWAWWFTRKECVAATLVAVFAMVADLVLQKINLQEDENVFQLARTTCATCTCLPSQPYAVAAHP